MKKLLVLEQSVWDGLSQQQRTDLAARYSVKLVGYAEVM